MEPDARYRLVGASVLILLALLAATVVWLRGSGAGANARPYTIYFERQSLEGLELRSAVTMRGLRVGSVTGMRFSARRKGTVEVVVALDPTAQIREGASASVDRHLVTGLATVRLQNGPQDSPLLTAAPQDEPYPVIAEGSSSMEQATDALTRLAQNTEETMNRINAVLSPANQAALSEAIENLRRATRQFDTTLGKVDTAAGSFDKAANELRGLASSVAGDAHTLTARYDELGAQATVSAREVAEAARKLGDDAQRLSKRADALLSTGDDELRASARALRSAADSVGTTAGRLRDPGQAIFGPPKGALGPGEGGR